MSTDKELSVLLPMEQLLLMDKRYRGQGYIPIDYDVTSSALIYRDESLEGTTEAHEKFIQTFGALCDLCASS